MSKELTPGVVFQPAARKGMQRGINWMLNAIRPTLGPLPGIVAIQGMSNDKAPELLDDGGTAVRRIIQIADRDADVGAMLLRAMLWRVHERAGDGTATAAVLFGSIFNQSVHYLASGGNAMQLRRYLERGMRIVLDELTAMSKPVEGQAKLAQVARAICYDPGLSKMLGEIFDIIGEYGQFELREGRGRDLEREYVEGVYWDGGLLAREMITDHVKQRTDLENVSILISDLDIEEPGQIIPLLDQAIQAGVSALMIMARSVSPSVISVLVAEKNRQKIHTVAVKTPFMMSIDQAAVMEDLTRLCGGRALIRDAGDTLDRIKLSDLGRARRVWGDRNYFGIIGGQGDPRALREHMAGLRARYAALRDPEARANLRKRIGKLMGGSAVLWVGAATESEIKLRKDLAERTGNALRGAILEGVLPGGGVAFLACKPALKDAMQACTDLDERVAYGILLNALEAPARVLMRNAGYNPDETMADLKHAAPGYGLDVTTGCITSMAEAGIMDVSSVLKEAWHDAVTTASLALTVDVLIHRRKPVEAVNPE